MQDYEEEADLQVWERSCDEMGERKQKRNERGIRKIWLCAKEVKGVANDL